MSHIQSLEARRLFATAPFGVSGEATLTFQTAGGTDNAVARQVLRDVAGHTYVVATTKKTIQVQRLDADGALQTTWGENGSVVLPRSGESGVGAKAQVVGNDRLIVLTKNTLYRFNTNGKPDAAFGTGGVAKLDGFAHATDFAIDSGNHIYVVGDTAKTSKNVLGRSRVERLQSRGVIDRTFQSRGVYDFAFPKGVTGDRTVASAGRFVRARADGTVVVAGTLDYSKTTAKPVPGVPAVDAYQSAKFLASGKLDASYGTGGTATVYDPADNELHTSGLELLGIRASGAVSFLQTDIDTLDYHYANSNTELPATGRGLADVPYTDPNRFFTYGLSVTQFAEFPDSRELALANGQFVLLKANSSYETTFNGGRPRPFNARRKAGVGSAVATRTDGSFLVAFGGPGRGGVSVDLFNADGTHNNEPVT